MERNVGEIFEYNGEWYQCLKSNGTCFDCAGFEKSYDFCRGFDGCTGRIFKKIHKTGKPFSENYPDGKVVHFQRYECYQEPIIEGDIIWHWVDPTLVDIEIKQNKENELKQNVKNMEENKTNCGQCGDKRLEVIAKAKADLLKSTNIENDEKEMAVIDNILFRCAQMGWLEKYEKEDGKLNLKPFDLEKAKAGKLVCTRDGRKARIICFDRKLFLKEVSYPILALVERPDGEDDVCAYNEKGKVLIEDDAEYKDDLMMLPEKKEGWMNVYEERLYDTKENAVKAKYDMATYIDTIKISLEE